MTDQKRWGLTLAVLGTGACALAAGAYWVNIASYRKARMYHLLENPADILTVSPVLLGTAAMALFLILAGLASLMTLGNQRPS